MRQWIVWCECRNSIHDIYVGMMSIFRHCIIVAMVVRPAITSSFSFKLQHRHRAIISHHHFIAGSITTLPPSSRTSRHRQGTHSHVPFLTTHHHDAVINNGMAEKNGFAQTATSYIGMMRPITIIQAVGAFLVGRLVILTSVASSRPSIIQELPNLLTASLSIYLSYGAGMAMNDCADVGIDSMHEDKQSRSVASETISLRNASLFCLALSILSIVFSFIARVSCKGSNVFPLWNLVNLMIMTTYALGLQRLFLVKNLLCGYLAISPLIGASLLGSGTSMLGGDVVGKLYKLAAIGFPLQVAREILKDVEDVKVDKGTKMTLPIGEFPKALLLK